MHVTAHLGRYLSPYEIIPNSKSRFSLLCIRKKLYGKRVRLGMGKTAYGCGIFIRLYQHKVVYVIPGLGAGLSVTTTAKL